MEYWNHIKNIKPKLSQVGSDFCLAPGVWTQGSFVFSNWCNPIASSVDAERAFSRGQFKVSHIKLQHNMSSQTFKADVAVSLWVDTPLRPGIMNIVKMVEKLIERRGGCHAECESDPDCEDDYRAWCWIQQWVNTYIQ